MQLAHDSLSNAGGIETITDLLVYSPNDIAKRCKMPISDIMNTVNTASKNQEHYYLCLDNFTPEDDVFTTGDSLLDDILGGGIKTGMVWEVAGER
jgi:DNA repair protein RAD57